MSAVRHFFQFGSMSRVGKQVIAIPSGVQVSFDGGVLTVKGSKGELSRTIRDEVVPVIEGGTVAFRPVAQTRLGRALWGTYASHARNMITGVSTGYRKELEVHGVGYRAGMKGNQLELRVGFSHPVIIDIPEGLQVGVKDATITVEGFDKEAVGAFAARVRSVKKPEPYKGKGIRYAGEVVRRKQGKKSE